MDLKELEKELKKKKLYTKHKRESGYWAKRFELLEESQNVKSAEHMMDVEKIYAKAIDETEKEISKWYTRYATKDGVSFEEARKILSANELKELKMSLDEYIQKGESLDPRWMRELEKASTRVHISRLEALQIQMRQQVELLTGKKALETDKLLKGIYEDAYYKATFEIQKGIGVGFDFAKLDTQTIENIVSKPWAADGVNFSQRIWGSHRLDLVDRLQTDLAIHLATGSPIDTLIKNISKDFEVSRNRAANLVYTEKAFFMSEAENNSFKELGVEQYQISATLDSKTSEICRFMDLKVFDMIDRRVGATAPPFHQRCRTCTVPYFDDEFTADEKRASRDLDGNYKLVPANMKYDDWHKEFVKEQAKSNSLEEYVKGMIDRASDAEPSITGLLESTVTKYGGKLEGLDYRLKGYDSLLRKMKSEISLFGIDKETAGASMYDLVRYTSMVDPKNLVKHYTNVVDEMTKKGYDIVRVKNTLGDVNADYRGLNCVIQTDKGYKFELQFHTPQGLKIKEINHKLYEEQRLDTTSKERFKELSKEQMKNWEALEIPKDIDKIKSFNKLKKG